MTPLEIAIDILWKKVAARFGLTEDEAQRRPASPEMKLYIAGFWDGYYAAQPNE